MIVCSQRELLGEGNEFDSVATGTNIYIGWFKNSPGDYENIILDIKIDQAGGKMHQPESKTY